MGVAQFNRTGRAGRSRDFPRAVAHRPIRAAIAMLILVPYLAGCFRYVPAEFGALPPGADVAIHINERGRTELVDVIGPGLERVDGQVLANSDADLVIAVRSARYVDLRDPVTWAGERVAIPRELISGIEQRTVDRTRSFVAGGLALIGGIIVSNIAIRALGEESERNGPIGNGDELL